MDNEIHIKEIGRINIEVEKKLNLKLEGDTNIYISVEQQEKIKENFGEKSNKLFDEFRRILKKPNFVRVNDENDFIYISVVLKGSTLKPYQIHFVRENGKYSLKEFGFVNDETFKLLNSIKNFVKIN